MSVHLNEDTVDEDLSDDEYRNFLSAVEFYNKKHRTYKKKDRVKLWAYLQQALTGDCTMCEPSRFKRESYAKWKTWAELEGTAIREAIESFVRIMKEIDTEFPPEL